MARRCLFVGAGLALVSFTVPALVGAQSSGRPDGMVFLPDVPGQWRALTERPEALGFHITTTPNPSACRHYQGIARVDGADGTPFFMVTRSGNTPELPGPNELLCDDSPGEKRNGNLIVFRMDSREKHGERMRSNRLRKGVHVNGTTPPAEDRATIYFTVVEGGLVLRGDDDPLLPKVYQHPGGMQVIGDMMALATDTPRQAPNFCSVCSIVSLPECDLCSTYDRALNPSLVMFFDVSTPEDPIFKSQFAPVDENGDGLSAADGIAVTPLPVKPGESDARYLMAIIEGFEPDDPIYFYRSSAHPDGLADPALSWELVGKATDPNSSDDAHQSLHFLREGNIDGALYITGARGHAEVGPFFEDRDRIDLYRVECDTPYCEPGEGVHLTVRFNGRRITPRPSTGGALLASLAAATGFHESPSGELLFYATLHDNDGPSGTVNAGEWRHINMVRDGSPTLLPSAAVNGPYEVDEGSTVTLTGSAGPAVTKASIQLFHETNFGGTDFSTFYPVVDYDDRDKDDFDDFFTLELQLLPLPFFHVDKARSWKWFAPVGCSIQAQDHHEGTLDEAKTLAGIGSPQEDADLSLVLNDGGTDDIDQEIDAVAFLEDCDQYYATSPVLQWDLDGNGSFETSGSPVTFDAGALDGPSVVQVAAQAQHPSGGPAGQSGTVVTVRNVPPSVSPLRLTDVAGNVVNVDVPFVLVGLPVGMSAAFNDPGLPDHQTATLTWGDGAIDAQNVFLSFDEAFGDGTGAAVHAHIYTVPGSFQVQLSVVDDDGGTGSQAATIAVLTPLGAVEQVITMLDTVIAATTDPRVRKDLERARKALAGNPNGNNGALNKIRNGQNAAAIAFLSQAIRELLQAQQGGADVGPMIALLQQVIAALVAQP